MVQTTLTGVKLYMFASTIVTFATEPRPLNTNAERSNGLPLTVMQCFRRVSKIA